VPGAEEVGYAIMKQVLADRLSKLVTDTVRRLVDRTPEGTGHLAANWRVGVGAPDRTVTTGGGGAVAVRLDGWREGQVIYITNAVPYAGFVEFGTARQAPAGMLALTVAELASTG
jgi:hypothetical protein